MNQYDFEPSERVSRVRVGRVSGKWVSSITLHLNPGLTGASWDHGQQTSRNQEPLIQINHQNLNLFSCFSTMMFYLPFPSMNLLEPELTRCLTPTFGQLTILIISTKSWRQIRKTFPPLQPHQDAETSFCCNLFFFFTNILKKNTTCSMRSSIFTTAL